ncbi:uncharacterized protein EURHEDRAFT_62120 [Aspergillus ruber CBS 135680]|uniref:Uncharacterized protein n=1 Tax=Aspergillus ruber (strain CBS 135680) TaxID=1388766 RepID=A0A017SDL0_ASPRC|nr:uncharacterized protein EURHEDRAFT_62120 [Aspergillus ruber CBS 135680]EYE95068.1 hypothetical protein EURHEDRAFT_62120 [Aspergillus ruber CBS 135680]
MTGVFHNCVFACVFVIDSYPFISSFRFLFLSFLVYLHISGGSLLTENFKNSSLTLAKEQRADKGILLLFLLPYPGAFSSHIAPQSSFGLSAPASQFSFPRKDS